MKAYGAIDLHSNNNYLVVIDDQDNILLNKKRQSNDLGVVLDALSHLRIPIEQIAIESTYNWYWLVDGLIDAGYRVCLVNTSKVKQYEGLKYGNDESDAFHLAHLMRLGILPTGYIYPKEERAVRDLLRRRLQLVRQQTAQILSIQNQLTRNTGKQFTANVVRKLTACDIKDKFPDPNIQAGILSNLTILNALRAMIQSIEEKIIAQVELKPAYQKLLKIPGIGPILAMTIMLETGDIHRFKKVGNYASYSRCVNTQWMSNNKQKGQGNRKNGNPYLGWAFIEAANFAVRFNLLAKKYYQRKTAKTKRVVALKAVAHKLARACYYVIRDNEEFDNQKLFC